MDVGGDGDVHHFGVGQVEVVHQLGIFLDRFDLQARVEAFFLADGGDRVALVVMGGEEQRFLRQAEQLVEDRVILGAGIAVLEIGAAGAADEQRVAGEDAVAHQVGIGIVRMAGRIEHVEAEALDADAVAFGNPHGHDIRLGLLAHHGDAMRLVAQRAEAGNVVGMQVRYPPP